MANAAHITTLTDREVAFGILTGAGRKGKKPENEFVLAVEVTAKERDNLVKEWTEFFNSNKSPKTTKPSYAFEDWFTESKTKKGGYVLWASELVTNGITYKVAPGSGYGMTHFADMGSGSKVDLEIRLFHFNNSYGEGLGMRLSAVKLNEFVKYSGGGGSSLEGDTLQGDGTQVESAATADDEFTEALEEFREAIEDKDWDEAQEILEDDLDDHPEFKALKKELKKAKRA